jgi:hypothetical protein
MGWLEDFDKYASADKADTWKKRLLDPIVSANAAGLATEDAAKNLASKGIDKAKGWLASKASDAGQGIMNKLSLLSTPTDTTPGMDASLFTNHLTDGSVNILGNKARTPMGEYQITEQARNLAKLQDEARSVALAKRDPQDREALEFLISGTPAERVAANRYAESKANVSGAGGGLLSKLPIVRDIAAPLAGAGMGVATGIYEASKMFPEQANNFYTKNPIGKRFFGESFRVGGKGQTAEIDFGHILAAMRGGSDAINPRR